MMTYDDAQRFLLDKLPAADADNMIRFIRGQEAQIIELDSLLNGYANTLSSSISNTIDAVNLLNNNGWISVDEPPVVSVGGVKEFNVVTRDQLGHQTVESALYLNQHPLYSEDSDVLDGYDDEGYRPETGWYKCLGTLDEEIYFRLHTVTHWQPLPPAPEQPK